MRTQGLFTPGGGLTQNPQAALNFSGALALYNLEEEKSSLEGNIWATSWGPT